MLRLENDHVIVQINTLGAELSSFFNKKNQTEYLWQATAPYWNRRSPILFPIVGTLKNGAYQHNGNTYTLPRHGFARDVTFEVLHSDSNSVILQLQSNDASLEVYPFHFRLKVQYELTGNFLKVSYIVCNDGTEAMYFSIGAHPGFNVPLDNSLHMSDYYLQFDLKTNEDVPLSRFLISEAGLQNGKSCTLLSHPKEKLLLLPELFQQDALILKQLQVAAITIASDQDSSFVKLQYNGFPYLGIWSQPNAPFVCIEPWFGITDHQDTNGLLSEKEGILSLAAHQEWSASWEVTIG